MQYVAANVKGTEQEKVNKFESRSALGIYSAAERARALETGTYTEEAKPQAVAAPAPVKKVQEIKIEKAPAADATGVGSSMELFEKMSGSKSDAPLCMTCGVKMRMAGSCFVCEGCGNTSGCS